MSRRIWSILLLLMLTTMAFAQQSSSVISEIIVRGNRRVLKEVILAQMRTKVGQPYVQETLDRDRTSIDQLGFFSAVDVRATPLEGGNFRVTVDVEEFPEIKEIRVVGNTVVSTDEVLKALTLKPGQVFNLRAREESASALRDLYASKGFVLMGVEAFGPMPESPETLNIALVEAKVGEVRVAGNTRTKPWVLDRLIKTEPGERLNITKWNNDLRRLLNTQWFESVRGRDEPGTELDTINLTAEVKEMRTGALNVGVQLDPRNSFAGVIRISEANLRGTGQSVNLNFIQATRGGGPSIDLDYTNPFFDNRDTTLRASIYSRLVYRFAGAFGTGSPLADVDSFNERRTGGSLGLSRPVNDYLSYGISGRYETVRTNNIGTTNPQNFIQQDGSVGVLSLGAIMNRRDQDIDPARGDWMRLEVEPGFSRITNIGGAVQDPSILGNKTFLRGTYEYRVYMSPGQPPRGLDLEASRKVVAARVRVGTITGSVPFFEQFFVGGSDSLRGYDEDRFWGRHSLVTSLEYRHPIQRSFNAIVFVDYGGAWGGYGTVNNFAQSANPQLHLGYGFGLSFRTPLGPIRLDLGFDERGKSRTHFMIGTSF